jgi:hypothetical protein
MDVISRQAGRRAGKIGARVSAFALAIALGTFLAASALAVGSTPSAAVYHKSGTTIQGSLGTLKPPTTTTTPAGTTPAATTPAATTPASTTPAATLGSSAASATKPGTQLPFTGLDLGLVVGAGFVLIALGFSLRRLTRKPSTP